MLYRIIILIAIAFALHVGEIMIMLLEDRPHRQVQEVEMKGDEDVSDLIWAVLVNEYGLSLIRYLVAIAYALYMRLTILNILLFIFKYVPTGIYLYKYIKKVYLKSKQRQMQMEEIQLQIEAVNTKLNCRDNRCIELAEKLRRGAERLRKVQACVRDVIATDAELRQTLKGVSEWQPDNAELEHTTIKEEELPERQYILELLKEMREVQMKKTEILSDEKTDSSSTENYLYTSPSDIDTKPDCRVKIIKVTNVYKIACLKRYIKQKKLLRASKQAMLKKKMENIKKMFEDWQNRLNMVINSKLTVLDRDSMSADVASQEAMGDYSKPQSMDSDSDIRNRWSDLCDDYNAKWKPHNQGNGADACGGMQRDMYDQDYGDVSYSPSPVYDRMKNIPSIIEEAEEDYECHDLIAL